MRVGESRTLHIDGIPIEFWIQQVDRTGTSTPFSVRGLVARIERRLIVLEEPARGLSAWDYEPETLAALVGGILTPPARAEEEKGVA